MSVVATSRKARFGTFWTIGLSIGSLLFFQGAAMAESSTEVFRTKMEAHILRGIARTEALRHDLEVAKHFPDIEKLRPHWDKIIEIMYFHDASKIDDSRAFTSQHGLPKRGQGSVLEYLAHSEGINFDNLPADQKKANSAFVERFNRVDKHVILDRIKKAGLEHLSDPIMEFEEAMDKTDRYLNHKVFEDGEFGKPMKPFSEYIALDQRDTRTPEVKARISKFANYLESTPYKSIVAGLDNATYSLTRSRHTFSDLKRHHIAVVKLRSPLSIFSLRGASDRIARKSTSDQLTSTAKNYSFARNVARITAKTAPWIAAPLAIYQSKDGETINLARVSDELFGLGDAASPSIYEDVFIIRDDGARTAGFFALPLETQKHFRITDSGLDRRLDSVAPKVIDIVSCSSKQIIYTSRSSNNNQRRVILNLNPSGLPVGAQILSDPGLIAVNSIPESTFKHNRYMGFLNAEQIRVINQIKLNMASLKICCETQCLRKKSDRVASIDREHTQKYHSVDLAEIQQPQSGYK